MIEDDIMIMIVKAIMVIIEIVIVQIVRKRQLKKTLGNVNKAQGSKGLWRES